ncbi:MAG: glucose 1-dehydrogenase [Bdellovibrionales bacterium]|nr:glucose 1-dehydrogenase [Bdellovibrionales bacterium]
MKAIAVHPAARETGFASIPEPELSSRTSIKIRILEVGVCATDREISRGIFGTPPEGYDFLVLGHESLGEVVEIGADVTSVQPGDLVVAMVRRPCGVAGCVPCEARRQDFCGTGTYAERGIQHLHGFMTSFVVEEEAQVVKVPPHLREFAVLAEPLTVAEKALQQVDAVQSRLPWHGSRTALVLGAGPVGLLGAMALRIRGYRTAVFSREPANDPKASICAAAGIEYISVGDVRDGAEVATALGNIDLVYEAAGSSAFAFDMLRHLGTNGVFVLAGAAGHAGPVPVDTDRLMWNMVLKNQVLLGTVNAGRQAFTDAIADLATFDREFPQAVRRLISRRYDMADHAQLIEGSAGGIKNVIAIDG